ncbi:MAG: PQQ-binding-like beta-propeller repeat protein [Opitutae bacterium]|nr:PQQ-binding-like beta-propeller repeat protein [Opitutae bacterium]MBT6851959.1 PQQ-binding-like beta-propeller repeat protein [Opitutae bacterium]
MKNLLTIHLTLILSLCCANADWTSFRGSSGNGFANEPGLPKKLDDKKSIAWKVELPGRGLSSPIVVGDSVFLTASSGPRQERLHVISINTKNGETLWERQFQATGRTVCHKKTCVAAPTAVSDGKVVVAQFSSNDVFCLDLEGNLKWLRGLTLDYPNAANSLGMSSSPVIADGVFVTQVENDADSFSAGIDLKSGKTLWRKSRPKGANWTSPTVLKGAKGEELAVLQSGKGLLVVEPKTGKDRWNYAEGASTIPSTTVMGDSLFIPSNGLTAVKSREDGRSHTQLWRANKLAPGTASPVISGNRIYVLNKANVLTSANPSNGELGWRLRLKGPFSGSPVANKTHFYVFSESGLGQVVDLTGEEGKVVSTIDLKETILCTPAISGNAIYLRSDAHLWKFGG